MPIKIAVGTILKIGGKPYECTRIHKGKTSYRAPELAKDMYPLNCRARGLSNVKVIKSDVEEFAIDDAIEVDEEMVWFQSLDAGIGPLVIYNYFNVRRQKDESGDETSTSEKERSAHENDSQRTEGGQGVRPEGIDQSGEAVHGDG